LTSENTAHAGRGRFRAVRSVPIDLRQTPPGTSSISCGAAHGECCLRLVAVVCVEAHETTAADDLQASHATNARLSLRADASVTGRWDRTIGTSSHARVSCSAELTLTPARILTKPGLRCRIPAVISAYESGLLAAGVA
jgi:hypothetical protein